MGSEIAVVGATVGEAGDIELEDLGRRVGAIESRVGYDVSSGVVACAREGETGLIS